MKKITNRIGLVSKPGEVQFESRIIDGIEPDQVLIKIVASAICGSDLHIFKGKHPSAPLPVTIGHEFSGVVEEIGSSVTNVKKGERVTVEPVITCGLCPACKTGKYGYCENISYTYRNGDGAMADHIVVKAQYAYPLPAALSFEAASLIEPLSVAVHAVRRAEISLGEKVLVLGAGAIGLLITSLCKRNGATEVIVVDRSETRLKMAMNLGATSIINTTDNDLYKELSSITADGMVDKSFECVGVQDTLIQSMLSLRKNGLATVIGIFEEQDIHIPASRFVSHEIKVQGSQGYCWDFSTAIELAESIPLNDLITHVFPLDDLQEAMNTCLDKDAGAIKVVVKP